MYKNLKTIINADIALLISVSIAFFILMAHDLNSWYYSAIGDEYALYNFARDIATKKANISFLPSRENINIFSQDGIYHHIPVASSYYQALIMIFFGIDHKGFILSSVFAVIASFWFYYFFIKDKAGFKAALVSLLIFASSHYLWAIIHTGYWNNQVFVPHLAAFFFFFRGQKQKNALFLSLAGIFSALGFYTYYSSRITIILLSLYFLLNAKRSTQQIRLVIAFYIGFFTLFLPFYFTNQETIFQRMLDLSIIRSAQIDQSHRLLFFFKNLWNSFLAFYHNPQVQQHFTSGSLVDPITVLFFSVGLLLMFISWRAHSFILVWFIATITILGGFSSYPVIPITRLYFSLPAISLISAYGIIKTVEMLEKKFSFTKTSLVVSAILLLLFLLNLNRFYRETPQKMHLTPEAVTIGAVQSLKPCQSKAIIIFRYSEAVLKPALESHNLSDTVKLITDPKKVSNLNLKKDMCIIFSQPEETQSAKWIQQLSKDEQLAKGYFSSLSKNRRVVVFWKKQL